MLIDFQDVNLLAVLIAAILPFGLGYLWYGKPLYGKAWQKEVGLTDKQLKQAPSKMANVFLMTFIGNVVMAYLLSGILHSIESQPSVIQAALFGLSVGASITGMSLMTTYLFAQRSNKLFYIDAGYIVLNLTIMGAVIGAIN